MFLKNKKKAESSLNERLTLAFNQSVKQKETLLTSGSFIPSFLSTVRVKVYPLVTVIGLGS